MTTLFHIIPFQSLGTKMVQISLSNQTQLSTNLWLTEARFLDMLEAFKEHRETKPEKLFSFDITDDGKRAE